jgi:pimeloyl-ACP methyl ester carboxylesterase
MNLYLISGLGADKRIFRNLDLPGSRMHHIEWAPVVQEETLAQYAGRLSSQIDASAPFVLLGLSFGGMLAVELARLVKPWRTVIVSSVASSSEMTPLNRFLGKLSLYRLVPPRLLLRPSELLFNLFGAHSDEERSLLSAILRDTDPDFFRWAMKAVSFWENKIRPPELLHIHGTADRILPYRENMQAVRVPGGEHLMIYSRAPVISRIINDWLGAAP